MYKLTKGTINDRFLEKFRPKYKFVAEIRPRCNFSPLIKYKKETKVWTRLRYPKDSLLPFFMSTLFCSTGSWGHGASTASEKPRDGMVCILLEWLAELTEAQYLLHFWFTKIQFRNCQVEQMYVYGKVGQKTASELLCPLYTPSTFRCSTNPKHYEPSPFSFL